MLLLVELFDSVAGFLILAEGILLFGFVRERPAVPGSGLGTGSTVIGFFL